MAVIFLTGGQGYHRGEDKSSNDANTDYEIFTYNTNKHLFK